jgi:hypothetical protein
MDKTITRECHDLFSAFLTHRRCGKNKRQSQALMEHLGLALRKVIGQACKTAAAFQHTYLVYHDCSLLEHYPSIINNVKEPI